MPSQPGCPFCDIVERDDPDAREVYRDGDIIAFFPTEPATLGHTLVVPRAHIEDIWGLDNGTAARLADAILLLSGAINQALRPEGLNVIQSNGEAATQTVPHLHVHLVPRWNDDRFGSIWPPETQYSESEKDEAWGRLKQEISSFGAKVTDALMEPSPEDRRKHLDYIQAVVTRMSAASSSTKSWLLPVVTATYGYALTKNVPLLALLGMAPVVLFSMLDANYLRQEKAYRKLYSTVASDAHAVPIFSLDASKKFFAALNSSANVPDANASQSGSAAGLRVKFRELIEKWIPESEVWRSWSIAPFYGGLLIVGLLIFLWSGSLAARTPPVTPSSPPAAPSSAPPASQNGSSPESPVNPSSSS